MLYKFKLGYKVVEMIKKISSVKGENSRSECSNPMI